MVGTKLRELAHGKDAEFILTARSDIESSGFPFQRFDFGATDGIDAFLTSLQPDIIIHTAAVTSVDYAALHPEETDAVNVVAVERITRWCALHKRRLVHFSTDFVFDGRRGMYSEDDPPGPISHYGRSKWKSEQFVQQLLADHVIIRTVLVYGYAPSLPRLNFPLWIESRLREGMQTHITADQFRTPTWAEDLAGATLDLALSPLRGTFHISGPEYTSVFDFAVKTALAFGLDPALLVPVTTASMDQSGERPLKTGFDIKRAREQIGFNPASVAEGLAAVVQQKKRA